MEIRVLRYFLAVAREESITAAANFLHLTQPTLSRQIHDLEEELGQQLLIRKSHRVALTPEGMLLRKRAEEILSMVDKTESEFRSLETTISGDVYIGSGETQAVRQIARIIRQLQQDYPDIHYHMHSGNAQDITDRLDNGLLDFGVLIQPADITKYDSLVLPDKDVWGVIMRKDSPLAAKQSVCKEDLRFLPLLCSRQAILSQRHGNAFASWFGSEFEKLNIVCTYNLIYNAAIMVEEGIGYAVTLDHLANTSANSALCFRPLVPRLESGLNIVWKKYQIFSPAAEIFLQRLQQAFEA
ncbi:LysR family transcriptional regulator [Subdoligranulum variabile]|uniref:Transcriptional regulator, LysR family n=1 Tax=Subdoligranulum variabile DSM 15176 TaxID=411471 RepID=D1PKJ1_9FIRM|nr:LysR family transcriptional regulator [Subdoligranulum variabile]EFB76499.1 transcriptional regulator, LysR family [Subdoligranulum variabile DSM 15176]UWP68257.1 LysR family transcriptional regulator [Subdoligranulum variabile]